MDALPERLYRAGLEAAPVGVLIADSFLDDTPIVYCNKFFIELTGYGKTEILGRNCRFLQGPATDPKTVAAVRRAVDNRTLFVGEILNYRKDGRPFWNQLTISPIVEPNGKCQYLVGIQKDITEQKHAEMKRDAVIEDLKSINIGLSNFASMASHEIKTPLGAIQGYAQLLLLDHSPTLNAEGLEFLNRIIENSAYLHKCVTNLLSLAALSSSTPDTTVEDLYDIIDEVMRVFASSDEQIRMDIEQGLPRTLKCNRQLVIQVFHNLISNAIKYGRARERGIKISTPTQEHEGFVEIQIQDQGEGIPRRVLGSLFEPFVTTNRDKGRSTGLGLTIVKRIMEMHGGDVACDTGPSGSTFILRFPKHAP